MEEKIDKLTEKIKEYLSSEMSTTLEDYKTLEKMNQVTAEVCRVLLFFFRPIHSCRVFIESFFFFSCFQKYHDMKVKCDEINQAHQNLKSKYECLSEYFAQIDNLEKKIDTLEEMAYSIDLYTKKLENQFKKLENS